MSKYQISEIPDLDPAEFDLYRAGKRTEEWFYQKIEDGILDLGHTPYGWVPIGKTSHKRVLSSNDLVSRYKGPALDINVTTLIGPRSDFI